MNNNHNLAINLSCISTKPTGISNYISNLFLYLKITKPLLLSSKVYTDFDCHIIPSNLTSSHGKKGHFNRLLWTQFKLPKILKKNSVNLLFSPIPEAPLWSQCRSVVVVHDFIPLRFPKPFSPLTPYHRHYIPQVLSQSQHIICNSQSTAADIMRFCQIPASKISPILLGYDSQHFQASSKQNRRSPHPPYFLYIGRHDPYKNISRLISAFTKLFQNRNYQLWLVGPHDQRYTPALQNQAQELGVENQVKFLDYVPYEDLPQIISEAIALVFPSLWEGFGLPVLEAMGCGTPVITSNISSLPEVAGDAAILIDPYNVAEIADAMRAIADDSALRANLSERGLARASQFSWEKTGRETVEVLQRFL